MIKAGCLVVHTQRCSETSFPKVTTRLFCLLKTGSTVKVFSSEKREFNFRNSGSGHSTSRYSSPEASEPLLHTTGASWSLSDSFLPSFLQLWAQWRVKFSSSVPVLSFSGMGRFQMHFDGFLAYSLRST